MKAPPREFSWLCQQSPVNAGLCCIWQSHLKLKRLAGSIRPLVRFAANLKPLRLTCSADVPSKQSSSPGVAQSEPRDKMCGNKPRCSRLAQSEPPEQLAQFEPLSGLAQSEPIGKLHGRFVANIPLAQSEPPGLAQSEPLGKTRGNTRDEAAWLNLSQQANCTADS